MFVACVYMYYFFSPALPSPPTGLNYSSMCTKYTNSTSQQLENGSVIVISTCQSTELVLFWEPASGNFDCDYYLVNILGNQTKVKITSFKVPNMPNGDYQVFVSTVSKCQETSRAVMINVPAGKNVVLYILHTLVYTNMSQNILRGLYISVCYTRSQKVY